MNNIKRIRIFSAIHSLDKFLRVESFSLFCSRHVADYQLRYSVFYIIKIGRGPDLQGIEILWALSSTTLSRYRSEPMRDSPGTGRGFAGDDRGPPCPLKRFLVNIPHGDETKGLNQSHLTRPALRRSLIWRPRWIDNAAGLITVAKFSLTFVRPFLTIAWRADHPHIWPDLAHPITR